MTYVRVEGVKRWRETDVGQTFWREDLLNTNGAHKRQEFNMSRSTSTCRRYSTHGLSLHGYFLQECIESSNKECQTVPCSFETLDKSTST